MVDGTSFYDGKDEFLCLLVQISNNINLFITAEYSVFELTQNFWRFLKLGQRESVSLESGAPINV